MHHGKPFSERAAAGGGRAWGSSEHSDPVPLKSVTSCTRTAPPRLGDYVTGARSYVSVPSRASGSVTASAAALLPASLSHSQLHVLYAAAEGPVPAVAATYRLRNWAAVLSSPTRGWEATEKTAFLMCPQAQKCSFSHLQICSQWNKLLFFKQEYRYFIILLFK